MAKVSLRPLNGCRPDDGIVYYLQNIWVMVDWEGFMPRPEVEDLPSAAVEAATTPEDLASLEPADEDKFIG